MFGLVAFIGSLVVVSSCGKDEGGFKNVVTVDGESFSLKNATVYEYYNNTEDMVSDESSEQTHNYLGYEIIDNATYGSESAISYYGWFELWYPINEDLNDDEFEVKGYDDEWTWTASSRIARFYLEYDLPSGSTYSSYIQPYIWIGLDFFAEDGTAISVTETESGNIRFVFSGKLEYWIRNLELYGGDGWKWIDEDLKNTKISVEGPLGTIPPSEVARMGKNRSAK